MVLLESIPSVKLRLGSSHGTVSPSFYNQVDKCVSVCVRAHVCMCVHMCTHTCMSMYLCVILLLIDAQIDGR